MASNKSSEGLSVWLWLYIPILILVSALIINTLFSQVSDGRSYFVQGYRYYYHSLADFLINHENGIIETATVLILIIGIGYGWSNFIFRKYLPSIFLSYWFLLITIACIYFAGEEISWGQHLIGWETPEPFKKINDQDETNIHNISSWFDQKPRLFLELGILIGGVFIPLIIKVYGIKFTKKKWQYWLLPSIVLTPVSILTILIKIPDRLKYLDYKLFLNKSDLDIFQEYYFIIFYGVRINELQELYFAYFLMLYMYLTYKKMNSLNNL